jgi:hypothetical protein
VEALMYGVKFGVEDFASGSAVAAVRLKVL